MSGLAHSPGFKVAPGKKWRPFFALLLTYVYSKWNPLGLIFLDQIRLVSGVIAQCAVIFSFAPPPNVAPRDCVIDHSKYKYLRVTHIQYSALWLKPMILCDVLALWLKPMILCDAYTYHPWLARIMNPISWANSWRRMCPNTENNIEGSVKLCCGFRGTILGYASFLATGKRRTLDTYYIGLLSVKSY